jgi:hypothetical protein
MKVILAYLPRRNKVETGPDSTVRFPTCQSRRQGRYAPGNDSQVCFILNKIKMEKQYDYTNNQSNYCLKYNFVFS